VDHLIKNARASLRRILMTLLELAEVLAGSAEPARLLISAICLLIASWQQHCVTCSVVSLQSGFLSASLCPRTKSSSGSALRLQQSPESRYAGSIGV
jgi:hypothetical protein